MQKYTVREGGNRFSAGMPSLMLPPFSGKKFGWWGYLGEEAIYDFQGDEDQDDWCKFAGRVIARHPWQLVNPHVNTFMLGFRYNTNLSTFQLTFYNHVDRNTFHSKTIVNLPVGEYFTYWIDIFRDYDKVYSWLRVGGRLYSEVHDIPHRSWNWSREIDPWFGGADSDKNGVGGKAPRELSVYRDRIPDWPNKEHPKDYL